MKLKHVNLLEGYVDQDAREVKTKFSKTFRTYFFPVGEEILEIVIDWITYLRKEKLWGNDDPLFPKTLVDQGTEMKFGPVGLARENWKTAAAIRKIFQEAFELAGLPYFNPHSFRKTLASLGEKVCPTIEHFKAWSQNLGHEKMLTTLTSYGEVSCHRQGEIFQDLATTQNHRQSDNPVEDADLIKKLREAGFSLSRNR